MVVYMDKVDGFYCCEFDKCDSLVLILHRYMTIFASFPRQIMMWCPLMFAHDVDLEEFGGW